MRRQGDSHALSRYWDEDHQKQADDPSRVAHQGRGPLERASGHGPGENRHFDLLAILGLLQVPLHNGRGP